MGAESGTPPAGIIHIDVVGDASIRVNMVHIAADVIVEVRRAKAKFFLVI